jgi:predicted NBD/HSP70 family sugar kinase
MALVDENGKVYHRVIVDYAKDNSLKYIISQINNYVWKYEDQAESIGIGVPGIIKNNKIV